MQQVRDLRRRPKESAGRGPEERKLAEKVRKARKAKLFLPEQEAELHAMQTADTHARASTHMSVAEEPANPMEGFADEAGIRWSRDPGIGRYGDSGGPVIRGSGGPGIRGSGDPGIPRSGDPEIRGSGEPRIR